MKQFSAALLFLGLLSSMVAVASGGEGPLQVVGIGIQKSKPPRPKARHGKRPKKGTVHNTTRNEEKKRSLKTEKKKGLQKKVSTNDKLRTVAVNR